MRSGGYLPESKTHTARGAAAVITSLIRSQSCDSLPHSSSNYHYIHPSVNLPEHADQRCVHNRHVSRV